MRTKEILKQAICEAVDRRRENIDKIGDQIMANPELGFKEFKTARLVADTLKSFEILHDTGLAITGVKGFIKGKSPGPTVALMGELDSLLVSDHPHLFEIGGENYHTDFDGWEYVRGHEGDPWRTYTDPSALSSPCA